MSGHSKWHRIKRKKAAADHKRGQEFTRLATQIQAAAKTGTDPAKNTALREAIQRAKKANMPQVNIDRLLQRAANSSTQTHTFEAFGPGGAALLITVNTDNNNRTITQLRTSLKNHQGSLGQPGSVMWKFNHTPQGHTVKYPLIPSPDIQQQVANLIQELKAHPDVTNILTDIPSLNDTKN